MLGLFLFAQALPCAAATLSVEQEIQQKNLAESPPWLKLLRYRRGGWSSKYVSEVDGLNFFLSPKGKHSPQLELIANVEAFLTPLSAGEKESNHAQCRFLARRNWLWDNLTSLRNVPKLPCKEREEWISKLNADSVSLIFADAYMGNPASMFGHTFLKFHTQNNNQDRDLLNYGINFAANTGSDGGVLFILKGLTGGYPATYSMLPYHLQLAQYTHLDNRDIWDYQLNFSPAEIRRMVEHLLELENTTFDYYFFDENCSYHLLTLFEAVRPSLNLVRDHELFMIPADSVKQVVQQEGLVQARRFRKSLRSDFYAHLATLTTAERDYLNEIVKMADVPESSLSNTEKAHALDTAMLYGAVKETQSSAKWQPITHKMKMARAKLGIIPATEIENKSMPPEAGNNSSTVRFSVGQLAQTKFSELEFYPAYHSWLSSDVGFLAHSQIEAFRLQVRHYESRLPRVEEFKILDMIATSFWDRYFGSISWRADVGIERPTDLDIEAPPAGSLRGGVGFTTSFGSGYYPALSVFALGHGQVSAYFRDNHRLGAGPQATLTFKVSDLWKVQLGGEQIWYFSGVSSQKTSALLRTRYQWHKNREILVDLTQTEFLTARAGVGWYF